MRQAGANHYFGGAKTGRMPAAAALSNYVLKSLYLQELHDSQIAGQEQELSNQLIMHARPRLDFHRNFHRQPGRRIIDWLSRSRLHKRPNVRLWRRFRNMSWAEFLSTNCDIFEVRLDI